MRITMELLFKILTFGLVAAAVNAEFPPCEICENGGAVGNPDTVIPQGFGNVLVQDMTCAEVQQMGADGVFNVLQCILLEQAGISDSCGCGEVSSPLEPAPMAPPTAPPVPPIAPEPVPVNPPTVNPVESTEAPASATTESPVGVPEEPATEAPAPAATEPPAAATLPTVTGSVYIRLIAVGDDGFETAQEDAFEAACSTVFGDGLADVLIDVNCTLRLFTLTEVDGIGNALNIVSQVVGTPIDDTISSATLAEMLPSTFNENAAAFVTLLQTEGSEESLAYFANVTFAEAFNPDGEIPPPSIPDLTPTEAPIGVVPTASPTAGANSTDTVFEGTGLVYIRLLPVGPTEVPVSAEAAFEEACTAFYTGYLEGILEDTECNLRLYTVVPDAEATTSNTTAVSALDVMTEVSGTPVGNTTTDEFEDLLMSIMTENSDDFITSLQLSGDEDAQAYFANVTDVFVFDRSEGAAPTAAPAATPAAPTPAEVSNDDDDGISGGAIAGIIVAVIAVVIGGILLARNCNDESLNGPSVIETEDQPSYVTGGSVKSSKSQASARSSSVTYRQSAAPMPKVKSEPLLITSVVSRSESMNKSVASSLRATTETVVVASEPIGGADRSVVSRRSITAEGSVANVRSIKDPSIVVDPSVIAAASASSRSYTSSVRFGDERPANPSDDGSSSADGEMM